MLLFLLAVQFVTGTLLLAHYRPGEDTAYESIVTLTTKVPLGVSFGPSTPTRLP